MTSRNTRNSSASAKRQTSSPKRSSATKRNRPEPRKDDSSDNRDNLGTWSVYELRAAWILHGKDDALMKNKTKKGMIDALMSSSINWEKLDLDAVESVQKLLKRQEEQEPADEKEFKQEVEEIEKACSETEKTSDIAALASQIIKSLQRKEEQKGKTSETLIDQKINIFARKYNLKTSWVKRVAENQFVSIQEARINDALSSTNIASQSTSGISVTTGTKRTKIPEDYAEYNRLITILMECRVFFEIQEAHQDHSYTTYMRDYAYKLLTPAGAFCLDELVRSEKAQWWPLGDKALARLPFIIATHRKTTIDSCAKCGSLEHHVDFCPSSNLIYHAMPNNSNSKSMPPPANRPPFPSRTTQAMCRFYMSKKGECPNKNCPFNHKCPNCNWIKTHKFNCSRK